MRGVEGDWAGEWVVVVVSEGRSGEGSGRNTTTMKTITMTAFVSCCVIVVLLLAQEGSAAPRCMEYDRAAPQGCKYGTSLDWCRNGVCSKGPGQRCGGYRWEYGKCGEGTVCMCGVCTGCSPFDGSCYSNAPIC
ncbi:hypothetical protein Pcinc_040931 [Petrolisthes cinctipes]|uniref:Neuroparsin n=1 Tax=Petrolisthes cinctipes TaxID=88211 RepID=A0AAE1BKW7_PETCI|nr:hypothetical protein Pcinc_040931 [Petrolisthes cinctipes]